MVEEKSDRIDQTALEELLHLVGDDRDSLNELIRSFISESAQHSENLVRGLSDHELLRRTAHTLKSSANDFGAVTLSEYCYELEQQAKNNALQNAENQVQTIQSELDQCLLELNEILNK